MKILHIGYALEKASGVTTFVENVAERLRALGDDVGVVDTAKTPAEEALVAGRDIVHLHGLWRFRAISDAARRAGVPVVFSTHGMTAPWSMRHKRWKKLAAWLLYQRRDLRRAAAVHCTTEQEVSWNNALGMSNCFVAPLGTAEKEGMGKREEGTGKRVLLFVGRIHPVKGLENLTKAWSMVVGSREPQPSQAPSPPPWKLRLVGPDEGGHLARLRSLVADLSLEDAVEFAGPRYGGDLSAEYEACDCLVLPSFTENFGATVADAMAHGKPVIASTRTPWRDVAERKCGWWVPNEPAALAGAIREMAAMSDAGRAEMGARGRRLVEERFSWDAVAAKVREAYERARERTGR